MNQNIAMNPFAHRDVCTDNTERTTFSLQIILFFVRKHLAETLSRLHNDTFIVMIETAQ